MPGPPTTDAPTVSLSFANNFWGKDDAGVGPLLDRMHNAKVTCDELKSFYAARASLEDEYARKLLSLARKPLGSQEAGTLRLSLDVVRAEIEAVGKAHQNIAAQMKSELDEPLAAFAGGMKERRKIVQTGIERLLKLKNQQTTAVNKARDKYEQDCLKIKGYLAQGHMVMGQEERKNKAKLEKTQIQLSSTSQEYEAAVKVLEETTGRWNRDWKAACDKFQDLEEERIDFLKSSLWTFANIASTVCVSDDASCEKIRLSLEDCDVEKDLTTFIKERGTGQEIPDPPRFIDFCRGDVNDSASEASDEGSYTVAQFPRPINPVIRSSSPQPSMLESHHDPDNPLARDFGLKQNSPASEAGRSTSQQATPTKHQPFAEQPRPQNPYQRNKFAMSTGDIPQIPHNPYPPEGMTQFCRTGPPPVVGAASDLSSTGSQMRPSSRDSQSEYSNPTSYTSAEPSSGHVSPLKYMSASVVSSEEEQSPTKKRGFFNSPFRRRSKHEKEHQAASNSNRSTWNPSTARKTGFDSDPRGDGFGRNTGGTILPSERHSYSPEPIDPRASFQLNVGNNVFDVTTPDSRNKPSEQTTAAAEMDPIAQALEELKGVTKASSVRVSADRYAGLATPAPTATPVGGLATPLVNNTSASAQRGPPPSYDQRGSMLGAPPAAHTARAMQETTKKYTEQKQSMFSNPPPSRYHQRTESSPGTRLTERGGSRGPGQEMMIRATSPAPPRAASPRPGLYEQHQQQHRPQELNYNNSNNNRPPSQAAYNRAPSPNPYGAGAPPAGRPRANTTTPGKPTYASNSWNSRNGSPGAPPQQQQQQVPRAVSPQPHFIPQARPGSSSSSSRAHAHSETALQLAPVGAVAGGSGGRPASGFYGTDARGQYGAEAGPLSTRMRTKSFAEPPKNVAKDGSAILHYARAMYMYTAQIPEELGFAKGDLLAVLRLQDDGWWEAEVVGKNGRGLVPSNYLKVC